MRLLPPRAGMIAMFFISQTPLSSQSPNLVLRRSEWDTSADSNSVGNTPPLSAGHLLCCPNFCNTASSEPVRNVLVQRCLSCANSQKVLCVFQFESRKDDKHDRPLLPLTVMSFAEYHSRHRYIAQPISGYV